MSAANDALVILGSGLAGYELLRQVRLIERERPIFLITADDGDAYRWSEFSSVLAAQRNPNDWVVATAEQMAHRYGAHLYTGAHVKQIDRAACRVLIQQADLSLPYAQLVLALGATSIRPKNLSGNAAHELLTLGSLLEYRYFFSSAIGHQRFVVHGGGLEGCEVAAALCQAGRDVLLCEPDRMLGAGRLPSLTAAFLLSALSASGVHVWLEEGVQALNYDTGGLAVNMLSGRQMEADAVVAALGGRPNTELARQAGLKVGYGVRINAQLQTSDPNIFALSRCAEWPVDPAWQADDADAASRTLAAVLCGRPANLMWRPRLRPVRCGERRLLLCEPPSEPGEWHEKATPRGVEAQFLDRHGRLRGFALAGSAVDQADQWYARVAL